jgi:hypothetical protein
MTEPPVSPTLTTLTPHPMSRQGSTREEELGGTQLRAIRIDEASPKSAAAERKEELGFRRDTFWKSCCGSIVDRRAVQFFVQLGVGSLVILFCIGKISLANEGENLTVYFSLLSAIVGYFIPSPSLGATTH